MDFINLSSGSTFNSVSRPYPGQDVNLIKLYFGVRSICSRYHWLTIKKRLASMICSIDAVRLIKSSIFCILDLARALERGPNVDPPVFQTSSHLARVTLAGSGQSHENCISSPAVKRPPATRLLNSDSEVCHGEYKSVYICTPEYTGVYFGVCILLRRLRVI